MTEWDKLWEGVICITDPDEIQEFLEKVEAVGDELQEETKKLYLRINELHIENKRLKNLVQSDESLDKNLMKEKLEAIREWIKDQEFQDFRDNAPNHADYPRFGDFYHAYEDWLEWFVNWIEKCPFKELARVGSDEEVLGDE